MFGVISEKFRTFDMQINFAIPPISHFRRWLGEFFSLFQSYEIPIPLSIKLLRKSETFQVFPDSPYSRLELMADHGPECAIKKNNNFAEPKATISEVVNLKTLQKVHLM